MQVIAGHFSLEQQYYVFINNQGFQLKNSHFMY